MSTLVIVNRSPDGSTYFSPDSMGNWTFLPIVEMVERTGLPDYITIQMTPVAGFPQLYFRLYGNFTFTTGYTYTGGTAPFVAAGSIINTIEVINGSGYVYNRLSGVNFAFNAMKTSTYFDYVNVLSNSFRPGETPDIASLMSGNDDISGNSATELLSGYGGHDTLRGNGGIDVLYGGAGNDSLIGGDGSDDLYGGNDNDTISGYTSGDYIDGGSGTDTWALTGTYSTGTSLPSTYDYTWVNLIGIEVLRVTWGEIMMNSNQVGGTSTIQTVVAGSADRDMLRVAMVPGATVMNLSAVTFVNWNNLSGALDRITLIGSALADTIGGSQMDDLIFGHGGANVLYGWGGNDDITGGTTGDTLDGGIGNDSLRGDAGNDLLRGLSGGDRLFGGAGRDTLDGGTQADVLSGGSDGDRFVFSTALTGEADTISDYERADEIALSAAIFTTLSRGTLAAAQFKNLSQGAVDASDRILYKPATGEMFYDADGSGGGAAIRFAIVTGGTTLTPTEFVVI